MEYLTLFLHATKGGIRCILLEENVCHRGDKLYLICYSLQRLLMLPHRVRNHHVFSYDEMNEQYS